MQANGAIVHPGDVLKHRYQVVQLLGQGGFGQTFEVQDLEDRGERKVLKVLLDYYPKAIELFQREAEVLQKLDCPGIPKVDREGYFTLQLEGMSQPLHCLVMEYVRGQNLEEWLEQNQPIDQDLALDWLKQLVEILGLLHDRNYFHRDIKPSNIMLQPDGQLALIDFGAVREISETYLDKMSAKHPGTTAIRSFGYCAPEQADNLAVPESDFFALGRTFVYLFTGQHSWKIKRDPKDDRLLWRVDAPQVSQDLADLIDDLMAPFRWQRPDRTQIIYRLERIAGGLPIVSPEIDRARMRLEAEKSETGSESRATTNRKRVTRNYEPEASHAQLRTDRPIWRNMKLKIAPVVGLLSFGLMGSLHLASPQIAVYLNRRGLENYNAKQWQQAKFYFTWAKKFNPDYAQIPYNLGSTCEELKDFDCARTYYEKAMQGNLGIAYNNRARLDILEQKYAAAVPLLLEALQLATGDRQKYNTLKNLGWAYLELGQYAEAKVRLQAAIALNDEKAAAYCLMAQVLDLQGETIAAGEEAQKCLSQADENNPDEKKWKEMLRSSLIARGNEL